MTFKGSVVARPTLPQQFFRISRRHRQVRSPKPLQNREIHTDHFAISIEERSTRPARCSRCVVNNLVLQHISNMPLRGRWPYQFLLRQLRNHLVHILRSIRNFLRDIRSRSRQNPFNSCRISDEHHWFARYAGVAALIQLLSSFAEIPSEPPGKYALYDSTYAAAP